MKRSRTIPVTTVLVCLVAGGVAARPLEGDPDRGERAFRACAACHSLEPGRHMTGPSLAGLWKRRAGTAAGFGRYSPALKSAELVWDRETLDAWLADPAALVPNNRMTFPGIDDARVRADLIAFLKAVSGAQGHAASRELPDLEALGEEARVKTVHYCGDTYRVVTVADATLEFWEFNLRFKTDSSDRGPAPGRPVLLRAGMMGDRAFIVFASPEEISALVETDC